MELRKQPGLFFSLLAFICLATNATLPVFGQQIDSKLFVMEQKAFSHDYSNEAIEDRLARLEKLVFGSPGNGTIEQRLDKLSSANIEMIGANAYVEWPKKSDMDKYFQKIERQIKTGWVVPTANTPDIVIAFDISKTGTVSNLRLVSSSDTAPLAVVELDKNAIVKGAPYPAPPAAVRVPLTIYFSFYKNPVYAQAYSDYGIAYDDLASPDNYMSRIQRRIKKNWFPPKDGKPVVVTFMVHKDGSITNIRLERDALAMSTDAAIKALERSSPLPPLPDSLHDPVSIRFTFDFNIAAGGPTAVIFKRF